MTALATTPPQAATVVARGPVAHAAVTAGERMIAGGLAPLQSWTMEATLGEMDGKDGVLAVVSEPETDCVRALVVRRGKVGVIGHSWRGGQALWCHAIPSSSHSTMHVAAALNTAGDLILYVDGRALRAYIIRGVFQGRSSRQLLTAATPVRFCGEDLPGWPGQLRDLSLYDHALTPDQVAEHARAALGLPEPVPAPAPTPRPLPPVGCPNPGHAGMWREDGDRLRCITCHPPRGCEHDGHAPYWVFSGDDQLRANANDWRMRCTYCETGAAHPEYQTRQPPASKASSNSQPAERHAAGRSPSPSTIRTLGIQQ